MNIHLLIELIVLLVSGGAEVIPNVQQTSNYPVCRPSTRCIKKERELGSKAYIYEVNGQQMIIDFLDGSHFSLRCNSDSKESTMIPDDFEMPALSWQATVELAEFKQCLIPRDSYQAALNAFNINVTKKLILELPAESRLETKHMCGLKIIELEMSAVDPSKPSRPKFDFLDELSTLLTLKLKDVVPEPKALNRLPTSLKILNIVNGRLPAAELELRNGSDGMRSWIEKLHWLRSLHLVESSAIMAQSPGVVLTPPRLFTLSYLVNASFIYMPLNPESLDNWLNGSSVKELTLQSCRLTMLPSSMFKGTKLTKFTLANNKLASLPKGLFTPLNDSLEELDLSNNTLNKWTFRDAVEPLTSLKTLKANNNPLGSLCQDSNIIKTRLRWPKALREFELSNTNATQICPEWIDNDELTKIDLRNNDIKYLRYNELKMRRVKLNAAVALDLSNNPNLSIMNVTDDDLSQCLNDSFKDANNRTRVTVTVTVQCHHGAYLLQERLRNCSKVTVKIKDGFLASDKSLCKYRGRCLDGCSCKRRSSDNAMVVKCTKGLPPAPWPSEVLTSSLVLIVGNGTLNQMPKVHLVELHAANNNISTIELDDIKDNLIKLDLRNNRIRHISVEVAQKLSGIGTIRNISLKGNKLNCKCADEPTFKLLENIVTDWSDIQCTDDVHVWDKMKTGLCTSVLPIVIALAFIALLVLTVLLCVLKYQPIIRKVLFKLNCCKRYVFRINDIDPTKDKDVFISYCYEDREKIIDIKNYLESKGYSTFEHTSDWQPGEFILDQIDESVSRSRRTLVILTDNFMSSDWMAPEFRSAHAHAMERRTSKVVIVKFDLLRPELLPSNLKLYLSSNTYLDWQNPNFWDKLILAMPTRISINAINK